MPSPEEGEDDFLKDAMSEKFAPSDMGLRMLATVGRATDISRVNELGTMCELYVTMQVGSYKVETDKVPSCENPKWDQKLVLDATQDIQTCTFCIWKASRMMGDILVAELDIDLRAVEQNSQSETWYPMITAPGVQTKSPFIYLKLSKRFVPRSTVKIIQARDLGAMDQGASSDPYALVTVTDPVKGEQLFKTKTVKQDLHPTWEESFTMNSSSVWSTDVTVTIFDCDNFFEDDFMGQVKINLKELMDHTHGAESSKWYTLKPRTKHDTHVSGQVRIGVKCVYSAAVDAVDKERETRTRVVDGDQDLDFSALVNASLNATSAWKTDVLDKALDFKVPQDSPAKAAFKRVDVNGDGSLDFEEVKLCLQEMGILEGAADQVQEEAQLMFDKLDTDKSGKLEVNEFANLTEMIQKFKNGVNEKELAKMDELTKMSAKLQGDAQANADQVVELKDHLQVLTHCLSTIKAVKEAGLAAMQALAENCSPESKKAMQDLHVARELADIPKSPIVSPLGKAALVRTFLALAQDEEGAMALAKDNVLKPLGGLMDYGLCSWRTRDYLRTTGEEDSTELTVHVYSDAERPPLRTLIKLSHFADAMLDVEWEVTQLTLDNEQTFRIQPAKGMGGAAIRNKKIPPELINHDLGGKQTCIDSNCSDDVSMEEAAKCLVLLSSYPAVSKKIVGGEGIGLLQCLHLAKKSIPHIRVLAAEALANMAQVDENQWKLISFGAVDELLLLAASTDPLVKAKADEALLNIKYRRVWKGVGNVDSAMLIDTNMRQRAGTGAWY